MPWCLSYFSIFLKEIRNNGEKLNKCPTCAVLFSVYFQCGAKKPMKWFVKNKNQIFITILSRLIWKKYYHTTQLLIFLCKYCEAYTIIVVDKICAIWSPGLQIEFCRYIFSWKQNFTKKTRIIIYDLYNIYLPFYVMFLSLPLLILHFFQFDKRKYYYQICIISKKNIVILKNYWVNFTTKRVDFFSFKRRKKLKGVLMFNATPLQEKKFINFLTKKNT